MKMFRRCSAYWWLSPLALHNLPWRRPQYIQSLSFFLARCLILAGLHSVRLVLPLLLRPDSFSEVLVLMLKEQNLSLQHFLLRLQHCDGAVVHLYDFLPLLLQLLQPPVVFLGSCHPLLDQLLPLFLHLRVISRD